MAPSNLMRCVTTLGVASQRVELEQLLAKEEEEVIVVETWTVSGGSKHALQKIEIKIGDFGGALVSYRHHL